MASRHPRPEIRLSPFPEKIVSAAYLAPHLRDFFRETEWVRYAFPETAAAYGGLLKATRRIHRIAGDPNMQAFAIMSNGHVRGVATAVHNVTVEFDGRVYQGSDLDYRLPRCADERAHSTVGRILLRACELEDGQGPVIVATSQSAGRDYNRGLYHHLDRVPGEGILTTLNGEDPYGVTLGGRPVTLHISPTLLPQAA